VSWAVRARVLHCPDSDALQEVRELEPGGAPLVVGRATGPDGITIDDSKLSRRHLSLQLLAGGQLRVTDLDSRNGTRVDRMPIVGGLDKWGDAVVSAGRCVLHAGAGYPHDGQGRQAIDPLVRRWVDQVRSHPAVAVVSPPGCGIRAFARRLHRVSGGDGAPLAILDPADWARMEPDGWVAHPGSTVALLGADGVGKARAEMACARAAELGARVVFEMRNGRRSALGLPEDAWVELPAIAQRRAIVWGRTLTWLREARGASAPTFSRGGLVVWLWAPMDGGWRRLRERFDRLLPLVADEPVIRSAHVRQTIEDRPSASKSREPADEPRYRKDVPSPEELQEALAQCGMVAAVGRKYGRSRQQVYRWMKQYGLKG